MSAREANRLLGHIAAALVVFTVTAFALKVIVHPERAARYTPLVTFHAVTMFAWMSLLASQAYLASAGRMKLHRWFGAVSLALVAALSVSGAIVSIDIGREFGRPEVTIVNIAAFVTFIPLYVAAIAFARKRKMHAHRQAMLIGTLAFMTPVYARVTDVLGLPPQVAIGLQPPLTIAITLGYEWAALRRVSKATAAMLAFSVAVVLAMVAVLAMWFV
ncbi:MAG: hypothetical protein QNI87_15300 [Erythrobacter sp.]|uniref:hypothetical protein n=1 Tax=Erythrobacter sp. TaxID=1042 RepID=UPI002617D8D0|nr:hypothetical protein [Erythrobacter sp.]MDJ0979891.1 hypothetical protein [Erythrobacter sp.]